MLRLSLRSPAVLLALVLASAAAGCGGGGGGGGSASTPPTAVSPPPPPPPPPSGDVPVWTQGVFQPASTFINRCEAPRTGVDIEGTPFPDRQGSTLLEKFWLRSWTQETYLWNTEVQDRNPAEPLSRTAYFALLRTFARTPSGKDKDDFHFSEPTEQFLRARNSAPTATYGARLRLISSTRPRDIRVLYTEPNSPASAVVNGRVQLPRGARIITANGIDVINGATTSAELDALNRALFPPTAGVTNTFTIREPGAAADRTITITSTSLSEKPVNRTRLIETPTGRVGYILFNTFSPFASERDIVDAMEAMRVAGVTDLILDLRYNGGGLLTVASQTAFMVAGPARTSGRVFERLRFNEAAGNRNPITGQPNTPTPFRSTGAGFTVTTGTPLPNLNLGRVYVLTTERTCSASEAVINGLRGINVEVVLIGTTTCGKPYGFFPTDNCGETYFTIQFQGVNEQGFGDYADGFIAANSSAAFGVRAPGCAVADDLTRDLGDPQEAMLSAALGFRATGACPTPPARVAAESVQAVRDGEEAFALRPPREPVFASNRDMTPARETRP